MTPEEARGRLHALGFDDEAVERLLAHFVAADARGKAAHGLERVPWLETQAFDPVARPRLLVDDDAYACWDGNGGLGYLVLDAVCTALVETPPARARLVVCRNTFPTGALGCWAARVADAGLVCVVTATSPRRLPHPDGGAPLTGTNPLAIAVPSSKGRPFVADVSMGAVTHGDVLSGRASPDELVPFGGPHAHKAFALAAGLQLFVDALAGRDHGAVLLAVRPDHDPVPAFRALADGHRLPGDS